MSVYDHAVVGAGIVGSWTALQLQKLGKNVLLLEQFGQPHTRGSSHGPSRLIRSAYEETFFTEMMPHALRMWRELEADTGLELMKTVGCLCIAKSSKDLPTYRKCVLNMEAICRDELDPADPRIKLWLSTVLKYEGSPFVFMDKSGGILHAHKALLAIQALFLERGGTMWNNCCVRKIEPIDDDKVKIYSDRPEVVTVRSVVVCAGTWNPQVLSPFLHNLPLKPQMVKVYYWKEKEEGVYSAKNGFPAFIDLAEPNVYGLPSLEYPGLVKVCLHGGVDCDPDARDKTPQCPKLEKTLKQYVKEHFPLLEEEPAIVETCMYTVTPDEVFLVDHVPGHKNIVFGAGFSGTGFKTSPVIGRILSEMAADHIVHSAEVATIFPH